MDDFVLIEMPDEPDCCFVASWLIKAAAAQTIWSDELRNPAFENRVMDLCAFCEPNLETAALEVIGALLHRNHVMAADLNDEKTIVFGTEFGLMAQLGFFAYNGRSYRITVPETVTLEGVRQAALNLLSTASDVGDGVEVVQPERLLHTLPKTDAEAWRTRLIEMRRFNADPPRGQTVQ
ncbi:MULTISPECIES: hypothetical protein [Bradyrhizobium]|uniref:hypothetical protein n=1 Tax=Bradyrhizobium TaxID=374 RepID=UPI000A18D2F1|nr:MULTISPECIES: hypothetical protein [Bradyrhizobium]OSI79304.1 hypothetical protein BSZ21_01500 [Bradyrhizobium canariense]WOH60347.1 hypothetical protein RX329_09705 [Bradyrhizobium sp. BWC-3-1]